MQINSPKLMDLSGLSYLFSKFGFWHHSIFDCRFDRSNLIVQFKNKWDKIVRNIRRSIVKEGKKTRKMYLREVQSITQNSEKVSFVKINFYHYIFRFYYRWSNLETVIWVFSQCFYDLHLSQYSYLLLSIFRSQEFKRMFKACLVDKVTYQPDTKKRWVRVTIITLST